MLQDQCHKINVFQPLYCRAVQNKLKTNPLLQSNNKPVNTT